MALDEIIEALSLTGTECRVASARAGWRRNGELAADGGGGTASWRQMARRTQGNLSVARERRS
jgi:hypothetical protein